MSNNKEFAFPIYSKCDGLTKREYFAIKVLEGILAGRNLQLENYSMQEQSEYAVKYADYLLAELEGNKK